MKFGDYLQKNNICTAEEIEKALAIQTFRKEKLGRILVELEFLTKPKLNAALKGYLCSSKPPIYLDLQKLRDQSAEDVSKNIETWTQC